MRELSLFSGIGGGLLGSLLLGWHTVAAVDFEPYCCEVLARRKTDGIFKEPFDIFCMDIGEFNRRVAPIYRGKVDIITGGFPCQPFSVAGRKKGSDDSRNGFPVLADTIRIVRPRYLFLENVPGLLGFEYFGFILATLSKSGYDVRWKVISAGEVGAPHRRERLWIWGKMADSESFTSERKRGYRSGGDAYNQEREKVGNEFTDGSSDVPDTISEGWQGHGKLIGSTGEVNPSTSDSQSGNCKWWDKDPADEIPQSIAYVGRMAYGIPHRVERLRGLGNAQVPQCMAAAFRILQDFPP